MPILINSAAAFYIPSEADITGADATNDGTTTGNASSTIVLPVGFFNTTLPTLSSGQAGALQTDNRSRLLVAPIKPPNLSIINYRNTALSSTKQEVKSSAGDVYGWNFINPNTVDVFIKFYNTALASVTVGTTTPVLTLCVPSATSASINGIFYQDVQAEPQMIFSTAIVIAAVTGLADNSTTAPSTAIHCGVRYI
jgi:hypothetical protein